MFSQRGLFGISKKYKPKLKISFNLIPTLLNLFHPRDLQSTIKISSKHKNELRRPSAWHNEAPIRLE